MTVQLSWAISFKNKEGIWDLGILAECNIERSNKNLADTATIILPEADMNKVLRVQDAIGRGDEVEIQLGYDANLITEFIGYIKEITTNDSSLKIVCEDALFLFRKGVPDYFFGVKKMKKKKPKTGNNGDGENQTEEPPAVGKLTSVKEVAQYVINQIDKSFKLDCKYDLPYERFTIHQATGYDVLAKIQEETGADIFFDMKTKTLCIYPAYTRKTGETDYSMQKNVETSSLKYDSAEDRKVEITIESVGVDGKINSYTTGTTGGDKIIKKVGRLGDKSIKVIAHNEYKNRMQPGYDGTFDTLLIPYVEPGYTIAIDDDDYPYKNGLYYAESVTTNFSEAGGKRTITAGIKLSV
ncbi:hypothetical protein [Chryseobacterium koreense]|uniref:Phage protein D n=1 Tax=Chryseobacterium koreense CCUG 49689 TaxID=1304281 RepID=A0A0J7IVD3_9FLAO|nr:hypothetical protein [Chryseobacterium koreense]KMQ70243.1 hypothetical protein ACM44_13400 [Chryseobacterium koreense CCUG 49689]MBB5334744.1 hypothetical protein [Chryseobacterium koreense]